MIAMLSKEWQDGGQNQKKMFLNQLLWNRNRVEEIHLRTQKPRET